MTALFSDPGMLAGVIIVFLTAGVVKGVTGLGATTVPVALMTILHDLGMALSIVLLPALLTNIWQALAGPYLAKLAGRLWHFLLVAMITIWFGVWFHVWGDLVWLTITLATLLSLYAATGLFGLRLAFSGPQERWGGPFFGLANGVLTGMTGSFIFPGVLFLQGLGLPREMLIQAIGLLCVVSAIGLGVGLQEFDLIQPETLSLSILAVIPAFIGMAGGTWIRQRMSEANFRTTFLWSMLALGLLVAFTTVQEL